MWLRILACTQSISTFTSPMAHSGIPSVWFGFRRQRRSGGLPCAPSFYEQAGIIALRSASLEATDLIECHSATAVPANPTATEQLS